jgi:hypothetical protein
LGKDHLIEKVVRIEMKDEKDKFKGSSVESELNRRWPKRIFAADVNA